MSDLPFQVVKPDVVFIESLLDEIDDGTLRVPKFQRPYLWNPKQMKKLFDSINQGYPIGSLLIWDTDDPVQTLDEVGPLPQPPPPTRGVRYILDGHQRLSTLFGALRLPAEFPHDIETTWKWWIWYDLRKREFAHIRTGEVPPHFLPIRSVLRTMDFLAECRRIAANIPSEAPELIERAETLAQRIKNYKIPINVVKGAMKQAVETFSRLNSTGRLVSTDQMVSALTYREGNGSFHLDSRIDSILDMLSRYHFGGINRTIIFRSIVAAMEVDIYKTDWSIISEVVGADLQGKVAACESGLKAAAKFLSFDIGVPSDRLLPYVLQLTMLGEFFRECPSPTEGQNALLRQWFWITSFTGWFAGANDSQVNEALKEFREVGRAQRTTLESVSFQEPARPFPSQFFMRSARVRTFALFLLSLAPKSLESGVLLEGISLVRKDGYNAFPYIIDGQGSSPGNRILLGADQRQKVRQQLLNIPVSVRDAVLESHGIPLDALPALASGKKELFVKKRTEHLAQAERDFMTSKGVCLPRDWEAESPDLDVDEEDSTAVVPLWEVR